MADALILIVEDNEKNMKLLRDLLQFHGYQTIEAMTAEEGLRLARLELPNLVLMDIQLPGMDGITAFMHLRRDPLTQHIPVIAVTASARSEDRQKIIEAGFDGYQTKPIKVKELPQHVRRALDGKASPSRDRDTV